jgi:hypothetical protein
MLAEENRWAAAKECAERIRRLHPLVVHDILRFIETLSMFNPLDHPVYLAEPSWMAPSSWASHVPFGMLLVDLLRPSSVVELGTQNGVSCCAFCQAVRQQ